MKDQGLLKPAPSAIAFYPDIPSSVPPDFGAGDGSPFFPTASNPNPVFMLLWGFLKCKLFSLPVSLLHPPLSIHHIKGSTLGRQCNIFSRQHY